MPKNAYQDLPPSLGPATMPPHINHSRLIHQPKTRSLRYAIETTLTLLVWVGLIYLIGIYILTEPLTGQSNWMHLISQFFFNMGMIGLVYMLLLVINLTLMSIWAMVNKQWALRHPQPANVSEFEQRRMMRAFDVSRTMFERLTQSNVVTIFHDEEGKIESIRAGCQIPENGGLSQFPPETFIATSWNSESEWPESELPQNKVANAWRR